MWHINIPSLLLVAEETLGKRKKKLILHLTINAALGF